MERYDWAVHVMYDVHSKDAMKVRRHLRDLGCAGIPLEDACNLVLEGQPNKGITYSNIDTRKNDSSNRLDHLKRGVHKQHHPRNAPCSSAHIRAVPYKYVHRRTLLSPRLPLSSCRQQENSPLAPVPQHFMLSPPSFLFSKSLNYAKIPPTPIQPIKKIPTFAPRNYKRIKH